MVDLITVISHGRSQAAVQWPQTAAAALAGQRPFELIVKESHVLTCTGW